MTAQLCRYVFRCSFFSLSFLAIFWDNLRCILCGCSCLLTAHTGNLLTFSRALCHRYSIRNSSRSPAIYPRCIRLHASGKFSHNVLNTLNKLECVSENVLPKSGASGWHSDNLIVTNSERETKCPAIERQSKRRRFISRFSIDFKFHYRVDEWEREQIDDKKIYENAGHKTRNERK